MAATRTRPRPSRVPPHDFEPDPDLGVETPVPAHRRGRPLRRWCRYCGLLGEPGDARHPGGALPPPLPDPVAARAWAERDRAVLGERDEGTE